RRLAAAREEIGGAAGPYVNVGVEAAVPRCPRLGKLRMQRKALEALLPATRLDVEAPARVVDIEVERCGSAIARQRAERPSHVVHEQAPASRLLDQQHHARRIALEIGDAR